MKTLPQPDQCARAEESRKRVPNPQNAKENLERNVKAVKVVTTAGTEGVAEWSVDSKFVPPVETGEDAGQRLLQARVQLQCQLPMAAYMPAIVFSCTQPDKLLLIQHRMMVPYSPPKGKCWYLAQGAREVKMEGKNGTCNNPIMMDSKGWAGLASLPRPREKDRAEEGVLIFMAPPCSHYGIKLRTRSSGICRVQPDEPSLQETQVKSRMVVRHRRAAWPLKSRHTLSSGRRPLFKKSEDQLEAIN